MSSQPEGDSTSRHITPTGNAVKDSCETFPKVLPPHPNPLIWKDQSRGALLDFFDGTVGGRSQVMAVGSWVETGRRRMRPRHSEMRGLGTAVQGFVFEKRASVSQRAWSQPRL